MVSIHLNCCYLECLTTHKSHYNSHIYQAPGMSLSQRDLCAQPAREVPGASLLAPPTALAPGGGRREDSALCATTRIGSAVAAGAGGRVKKKDGSGWGVEEIWAQPEQQDGGELLSCIALLIQTDAAELPGAASLSLWVEAAS